ncbi:MAG TPA: hypothetical protein IAB52_00610 [Candidatus Scatomonas merdavium]|nr:hypothetical protein [Candidatus Scatomonas merdavium]
MSTNGLDFRKQYNSDGEIRYTYMPYLEDSFADGDCSGINPGCVVVMDENYEVIDEIYYLDENGDEMLIDPHGFIWIDDSHYIVAAYKQETVDVPGELGADDNLADLAVLYIEDLWSVGGNYSIDSTTPPEWSMIEYTETDGDVSYHFCFRFDDGTRRLYCSNKCE